MSELKLRPPKKQERPSGFGPQFHNC